MNQVISILIVSLLSNTSSAAILEFSPLIRDENLSDEAIELLHCLSDRSKSNWEITEKIKGTHYLILKESNLSLEGEYKNESMVKQLHLKTGEAATICQSIYPSEIPNVGHFSLPASGNRESIATTKSNFPWAIAGVGLALIGGFFLWKKSSTPDHQSIHLN